MNSPRERLLAETLKNKLIAIQKSEQVYKELSKWERNAKDLDEKEIDKVSKIIASKVDSYFVKREKSKKPFTTNDVMAKIQEELEKI